MLNGIFRNPTTIFFGKDAEENLGAEIRAHGSKVLLVYGEQSFARTGLSTRIRSILNASDIEFFELGGVRSNPRASLVRSGIAICRKENIQFILGVGGGSVIDAAKAISIGAPYAPGEFLDLFLREKSPIKSLPIGVVLTLPGTGSESNDVSVITDDRSGRVIDYNSPLMFPKFAILNPQLSLTAPPFYRACGVVDAISHVLERYFSNTANVDCSDQICEGLLRNLIKYGPRILSDPQNYDYNAEIMWASKLAHDNTAGFGRKQDWASHKICHELAARHDVVHGAALAVIFPAWMNRVYHSNEQIFQNLSERVFIDPPRQNGAMSPAASAVASYKAFLSSMGMPATLRELKVNTKDSFDVIASACVASMPSRTIGNLKRLTKEDVVQILDDCF